MRVKRLTQQLNGNVYFQTLKNPNCSLFPNYICKTKLENLKNSSARTVVFYAFLKSNLSLLFTV